ncbi:ABC transporter ATP-binding protein [Umezawaea sp. Da 62-37]|uniref:ABC transporter ATP-binding protein n=1 Tax=Umezawaea sp. Da 62-37 TaxID=3075927 RepID=UPI0028F73CFD|nr:ABC transporter ATP-binding protein [Umezawaea sp. Da 62-37]WNV90772.1 ABC transporter ATP-binding protein [Umezawaea sp. Da 62-37]
MRPRVPYDDPGTPDARGPARYLWWLVVAQRGRVAIGVVVSSTWMVLLTLPPLIISRAVDEGLRARDTGALVRWSAALLGIAALNAVLGMLRHRVMSFIRIDASYRTVQVVVRQVVRLGAALPRRVSAGEVVNIGSTDVGHISRVMTTTGPGVGAVVAFFVVAVLLLEVSPTLALVVLVGVPLMMGLLVPLLNRLQATETGYRVDQAAVTARAGDIVSGLRVLCGIGGKDAFAGRYRTASRALQAQGYRVGAVTSWIQALGLGLPSLFLAVVTWLAARMAATGGITVGGMIAVYGYVAVLITPVYFLIEGAQDISRGLVAARRVVRLLVLAPDVDEGGPRTPGPTGPADLRDPDSGLVVPAGRMLAVAAARPSDAVEVVDRLGRYVDSGATWGSVPLAAMGIDEVRRRILVADNDAHLFAGALREAVAGREDPDDEAITAAVRTAAAADAVPDGLDSEVDEQGRTLSGGQRQRLRLVRALLADPDVLLLVEPTSAVDAHTEALIASRVHAARKGRTTVVTSTSPLLLDQADEVAYLVDGRVVATGTHPELLAHPGYRGLVFR